VAAHFGLGLKKSSTSSSITKLTLDIREKSKFVPAGESPVRGTAAEGTLSGLGKGFFGGVWYNLLGEGLAIRPTDPRGGNIEGKHSWEVIQLGRIAEGFLIGWNHEFGTTCRVLERLPEDTWDWKPHPKSMALGELAGHLVGIEPLVVQAMEKESFVVGERGPSIAGKDDLLDLAKEGHAQAVKTIGAFSDEKMRHEVALVSGGRELLRLPVIGFLETGMKAHTVHHRGQLTVYLRLLDIPVPSVYGPSAGEGVPEAGNR
jgi:uncharacterized damage-inducible protein DinB